MKNSEMPAMPNDLDPQTASYMAEFGGTVRVDDLGRWQCGLTKREYFAGLAMQGLLAGIPADGIIDYGEIADDSIRCADALLTQLEKPNA
jgi:hypothetical protein